MDISTFLDSETISKIRGIQIRARYLVNDVFAGEYQSAFKGRGLEFEEVREYAPGDDIRMIDWNVTARMGAPYLKLHRDERELTVMFMVDVSASSKFGTVNKLKNEIAAEITALLAYTALKNNDKVGLIIFSDHVEHYLPPKKGRGHIWRLIRDILTYETEAMKTDLDKPLEFLNTVVKKKSIVFMVSDFQVESFEKNIKTQAKHHDLVAIEVQDRREKRLPPIGFIELEDAETGESILIDTFNKGLSSEFQKLSGKHTRMRRDFFQSAGIDYIQVTTDSSYFNAIVEFFRKREKKRR